MPLPTHLGDNVHSKNCAKDGTTITPHNPLPQSIKSSMLISARSLRICMLQGVVRDNGQRKSSLQLYINLKAIRPIDHYRLLSDKLDSFLFTPSSSIYIQDEIMKAFLNYLWVFCSISAHTGCIMITQPAKLDNNQQMYINFISHVNSIQSNFQKL